MNLHSVSALDTPKRLRIVVMGLYRQDKIE